MPGIRARNTETIAIEEAKMTRNVNAENLLTSIATSNGVLEFIMISGLTIERVNQLIIRYKKTAEIAKWFIWILFGLLMFYSVSIISTSGINYAIPVFNDISFDSILLSASIWFFASVSYTHLTLPTTPYV